MSDEITTPDDGMPPAESPASPEGDMGAPAAPPAPEMWGSDVSQPEMPAPEAPAAPIPPSPAAEYPPPAQYAPPPPPPYTAPAEVMPLRPGPASDSSKVLAGLGYIFAIIAIVMLFIDPYKDEKFVRFHAVQAIAIWVANLIITVLLYVPILGWIVYPIAALVLLVFAIIALVKAFQGEYYEVPVVYPTVKGFLGE